MNENFLHRSAAGLVSGRSDRIELTDFQEARLAHTFLEPSPLGWPGSC